MNLLRSLLTKQTKSLLGNLQFNGEANFSAIEITVNCVKYILLSYKSVLVMLLTNWGCSLRLFFEIYFSFQKDF